MFNFLKRKKKESESAKFHFNEIILKTMSDEAIKCEDINVYFSGTNEHDIASRVTHDGIRSAMIKIGYIFSYANIVSSKLSFEGAIRLELNKVLCGNGVQCDRVSIQNISKIW